MKVKTNPRYHVFLAELKRIRSRFVPWRGIGFRATPLPYAAAVRLLDGIGSLKFGGRWSAAGSFPAVNVSLAPETAIKESSTTFTYYNFASIDVRPKLVAAVELKFAKLLDLTEADWIGSRSSLRLDELLTEDWRKVNDRGHESQSQAFGRAAHKAGAEGILIPSARVPGGVNLVYFPKSLSGASHVEILGEDELERWLRPG